MVKLTLPQYTEKELDIISSNNAANIIKYWGSVHYIYQETLCLYDILSKFTKTATATFDLDDKIRATYHTVATEIFGQMVEIHCVWYSTAEQSYIDTINELQERCTLSKETAITIFLNENKPDHNRAIIHGIVSKIWFEVNQSTPCFDMLYLLTDAVEYAKRVLDGEEIYCKEKELIARLILGCYNPFLLKDKKSLQEDIITFTHLFDDTNPYLSRPIKEYRQFGYTRKGLRVMVDRVQSLLNII